MTIRVLHVGTEPVPVADELRRRGDLAVESASSASDALDALPADFDCILLEDGVPGGGLATLGALRRAHPDLPVVLLVADPDGGFVVEPLGPGSPRSISLDDYGITTLASVIAARVGSDHDRSERADSSVPTQAIVDTIGDGVYTLDAEGRFTAVNDTMAAMTGYDRDELVGTHCSVVLGDRDIAASEREIRALLEDGEENVKSLDITVYAADGTEIPCENRFSLLPFEEDFRGTVGVIRDIAERKHMEAKLRESRDKIADLHRVGTEMIRCETRMEIYELAVEAAEAILAFDICGIDAVEGEYLVPKYTSSGMPGDGYDRMGVEEGVAGKTYRNGKSYLVEDVREHADALPAQTEYRSVLSVPVGNAGVFQAGSREVGSFDDTDVELAELLMSHVSEALARVRSESALKESEAKYRTLVEQSRDAVFIYRGESFVFFNERTCELSGYTEDQLHDMTVLDLVHPDEHDRVREILQRRWEGEEIPPYETQVVVADGSVRHFEINAQRITYDGEPAVLASARDVTDRKRRKREIERQNERLKEFTSVVSHDLRNPLNVATGYLDLAQESGDPEYFERIERSLDRMEQLIDDLLSQARHGQAVTDPQLLDLSTVVRAAWENVDTAEATLLVETERTRIEADENQLMTMLENLFRNAVEHVGPTVTVTVGPLDGVSGSDATGDSAGGFFVADDGPGIPSEDREEIFERGYSETDEGTGLGLSIVEGTVEAHGWRVELRDGPDGGACFEFITT